METVRGKGGASTVAIRPDSNNSLVLYSLSLSLSIARRIIIGPLDEHRVYTYLLAASRSDPVRMAAIVYETCAGGLSVHEIALLILAVAIKIPIPGTANNGHC